MQPIDYKFVGLISSRLPLFKKTNDGTFNFRCIICGDSQTNKRKARGFILTKNNQTTYYCHNCHASMSLPNFIKHVDPQLYDEYQKERLAEKYLSTQVGVSAREPDITRIRFPKYLREEAFKKLQKVSSLDPDNPAKRYVNSRKIPSKHHFRLFLSLKFKKWVNTIVPDKFESTDIDEARLVIPFVDMDGSLIGFTGRAFGQNKIRYISIHLDTEKPFIFGLDTVDKKEKIYVTEGPIDSLFLPNALAMGSSSNFNGLKQVLDDPSRFVIVLDNEPKNKDICKIVEKAVDLGYNVCVWPSHIEQKDINEMVLSGMKPEDVKLTIDCNTVSGLEAKLRITQWKKC